MKTVFFVSLLVIGSFAAKSQSILPENPENLIAYEQSFVEEMAKEAGLKLVRVLPGFWSDRHPLTVNEHDLFLLEAV